MMILRTGMKMYASDTVKTIMIRRKKMTLLNMLSFLDVFMKDVRYLKSCLSIVAKKGKEKVFNK